MSEADPDRPDAIPAMRLPGASTHELIVDALGRILFETDMALELFADPSANELRWIEEYLRKIFDEVNGVMLQITD